MFKCTSRLPDVLELVKEFPRKLRAVSLLPGSDFSEGKS